uniref:Uncharacterized protein n=1 Tax=Hyaloperonospora arabidopsidis (strain Emoy2) TaxID=559515 RepID=M4B5M2_HYAAE
MHPRSTLSRPSPKRSLSCAGLDNLDELLHTSDNVHHVPNRKRHQSLTSDDDFCATPFAKPMSPSRHDGPPPLTSYPESLHRPELPPFAENSPTSEGYQLIPSSPFEAEHPQSSDHVQVVNHDHDDHSDSRDSNHEEEHSDTLKNVSGVTNAKYGGVNEHDSNGHNIVPNLAPQEPQDVFEPTPKLDHDVFAVQRLDRTMFFQPSLNSSAYECSPREEFLVQAFGPSGFKLHGASVSSNEDLDESLSDDGSSNSDRNCSPSSRHFVSADTADAELKMSCNELEADLRGVMHQDIHRQQHSPRRPELVELSHHPSAISSHGSFGPSRSSSFFRSNAFQSKGSRDVQPPTKWLCDEDERLRVAVARFGGKNWKMIAETLGNGRTDVQCLHRWNKVLKPGLIKGPWTPEEDGVLAGLITRYGVGKIRWCDLALHLPGRIGKQCRERWCNHLDSRIRKGQWTSEEDDMVFRCQQKLGNKWSEIAKLLPGRTENAVKNRFNSAARRKWLMNHATHKLSSTGVEQTQLTLPTSTLQFQLQPQQQEQHPMLQSSLMQEEGNPYNISNLLYGGEKVSPLPPAEALLEHHSHKSISPLEYQHFIQHFLPSGAPSTGALLPGRLERTRPGFSAALDVEGERSFGQQEHDTSVSTTKRDTTTATPIFVPPPLNSLLPLPTANTSTGANRSLHHSPNGQEGGEATITSLFPVPTHFPTRDASENEMPLEKSTTGDMAAIKTIDLPLLQLKEEKTEQDGLVLDHTTSDVSATSSVTDSSVSMDDENMNSFLDSVALELDDIME